MQAEFYKKKHFQIVIFVLFVFVANLLFSLFLTCKSINYLQQLKFDKASQAASQAKYFPLALNTLTLHSIPDLEIWQTSLELVAQTYNLQLTAGNYLQSQLDENSDKQKSAEEFKKVLKEVSTKLNRLEDQNPSSFILHPSSFDKLNQLKNAVELVEIHLSGRHTYILILQNSEELRATGGFMGSFALVTINDGNLEPIKFYDIYDADGQFDAYIEAPTGVKEYLSGGKGLRLPDANWHPDFAKSSEQILQIMGLSDFQEIDGVIAINLDLIEDLLDITGGIYVNDYGMTVTSQNLSTIARADRSNFFPGSSAKKDFLSQLFSLLKIRLSNLNSEDQIRAVQLFSQAVEKKDLQFFSRETQIQAYFEKLKLSSSLPKLDDETDMIYLVESNVGINKVNKMVKRNVNIIQTESGYTIEINYKNNSENEDYINYLRIIQNQKVKNNKPKINKESINTETIKNYDGEEFVQTGFLVEVAHRGVTTVTLEIQTDGTANELLIVKQPGLEETPYSYTNLNNETQSFVLDKNTYINF